MAASPTRPASTVVTHQAAAAGSSQPSHHSTIMDIATPRTLQGGGLPVCTPASNASPGGPDEARREFATPPAALRAPGCDEIIPEESRRLGDAVQRAPMKTITDQEMDTPHILQSHVRKTSSKRTKCKAGMKLKKIYDDAKKNVIALRINLVQFEHNHEFSTAKEEKDQLQCNKTHDPKYMEFIGAMQDSRIPNHCIMDYVSEMHGGLENVPAARRRKNNANDVSKLLQFFASCKKENPQYFCDFQLDKEGKISSIFWSHASQQGDYIDFDDAVTFDTTHKANLYDKPLGMAVMNRFEESMKYATAYKMARDPDGGVNDWVVQHTKRSNRIVWGQHEFKMMADVEAGRYTCECKQWEHTELFCVHLLCAFQVLQIDRIPKKYVLQRYTNLARQDVIFSRDDKKIKGKDGETQSYRQKTMLKSTMKIINKASMSKAGHDKYLDVMGELMELLEHVEPDIGDEGVPDGDLREDNRRKRRDASSSDDNQVDSDLEDGGGGIVADPVPVSTMHQDESNNGGVGHEPSAQHIHALRLDGACLADVEARKVNVVLIPFGTAAVQYCKTY
ncbi:hypothetical protein U9M48_030908 [Paspalum notatum var. saurae]|uniref:SWIM-type domain-containing protein n=1 Tax=Paspalum notatum var. saurae TaxID=547442 RepID=A0AAQ3U1Y7_PASNO